jgi:hypothetical protein
LPPDLGCKIHAPQFLTSDILKTATLGSARTVFNFNKIYGLFLLSNDINFANFSFPITVNDLKPLLLQQLSNGRFGF